MPNGAHPAHGSRASRNGAVRRKSVLVIEDHASVGGLVAALVRQDGYRAVRAWDAREAVRLARARTPELVILDLALKYPDGLMPLRMLRQADALRETPVVLVAPAGTTLDPEDASSIRTVISRPFDMDVMLNAVRGALGDPLREVTPRQFDTPDYFLHGY